MPREGYRTITVPEAVYDLLNRIGAKQAIYLKKGVTSFTGYLTYLSEEEKKRNP